MKVVCSPCIIIIRNKDGICKWLAFSLCFIKVAIFVWKSLQLASHTLSHFLKKPIMLPPYLFLTLPSYLRAHIPYQTARSALFREGACWEIVLYHFRGNISIISTEQCSPLSINTVNQVSEESNENEQY